MTQLANRRVALLDANVLFPFRKRDILLRFHHAGLFRARWTERILDEWTLNLLEQKPHLERSVRSQRQAIREHFAEAMVTGYEPLIGTLDLVGLLEEATPCRGVDGTPPRQLPTSSWPASLADRVSGKEVVDPPSVANIPAAATATELMIQWHTWVRKINRPTV